MAVLRPQPWPPGVAECKIALEEDFVLNIGEPYRIACTVFPEIEAPEITWANSAPEIAEINNGVLLGYQSGVCTITVTCGDISASVNVTIYNAATDFELSATEAWVLARESYQLSIQNVEPSDAQVTLTWESSDESLATVDENGAIRTIKPGDVTISVISERGIKRSCLLHLCYPVTAIEFEPVESVAEGNDIQLTANVTMRTQNCVNHLIAFSSSNEEIATVDENGLLHAVNAGEVTITARSASAKTASITIPVGHAWGEVTYSWQNHNSQVTASRFCEIHTEQKEEETVTTIANIQSPTEELTGFAAYTAVFENDDFDQQGKEITIPAIGDMNVIRLPDMLTEIDEEAFEDLACEAVLVPNCCTSIGRHAFRNCQNLTYVRVPAGTEIANNAFENCDDVVIDRVSE